jgi:DNA-binding NarL/FixJ family response regulator
VLARTGARGPEPKGCGLLAFTCRDERSFLSSPRRASNPAAIMNFAFDHESPLATLTDRERVILRELARGASLKEAAHTMRISYKAADHLKQKVMKKLDLHDRVALCLFALREGLIS